MADKDRYSLKVAITLPVKETFFYTVPAHLATKADVGCRVMVPFRNRKVIGYVLEKELEKGNRDLKDILDILDPEPLFHEGLVPFFQWMADYYLYPIGRLIQSALPGGINVAPYRTGRLTEKGFIALNSMPKTSEEGKLLSWINANPGKRLPPPLHTAYRLQRSGWIQLESRTSKRSVGPLKRKFVRLKEGTDLDGILSKEATSFRAKNEVQFLEALSKTDTIPLGELSSRFSNGPYLVNKWKRAGVIETYSATVMRDPAGKIIFPSLTPPHLFDQQKDVLTAIQKRLKKGKFSTFLLHGVTGSGKTEVYLRAVQHAIDLGRQAIVMVPEIALAIYMEGIFRSRLGNRMTIFHSGLSKGERFDQWIRMLRGEVDLVIGARSALFAPLSRLGLIIVDEEYDLSYKQDEGPRYQARDAAIVRAKIGQAVIVLGSGTPSIQSFHNTMTGRYHLLSMPHRIEKRPLPDVEIVDMKTLCGTEKNDEVLSPTLMKALEQTLAEGKQTILFLNRRGFSRVFLCRSCGEPVRCTNCDLSLTYHLKENHLSCHYCGFYSQPHSACPACGHKTMKAYGFGTEKLEKKLGEIFPEVRIARIDRDSTRRKGQTFNILKRFSEYEIEILVGTQMITKGYDFPHVTLVGVVAADLSLGFPDFRAGERTFQILSQVAGRAGRGDQRGRVIIQTFNPDHYAIRTAKEYDFESFFKKEIEIREELGYPPFSYLACLRFEGNDQKYTATMAKKVGQEIRGLLECWPKRGARLKVLGPAEAPLAKLRGKHRWQILIKSKGAELLHYLLRDVERFSKRMLRGSGANMIIDVDPYQML